MKLLGLFCTILSAIFWPGDDASAYWTPDQLAQIKAYAATNPSPQQIEQTIAGLGLNAGQIASGLDAGWGLNWSPQDVTNYTAQSLGGQYQFNDAGQFQAVPSGSPSGTGQPATQSPPAGQPAAPTAPPNGLSQYTQYPGAGTTGLGDALGRQGGTAFVPGNLRNIAALWTNLLGQQSTYAQDLSQFLNPTLVQATQNALGVQTQPYMQGVQNAANQYGPLNQYLMDAAHVLGSQQQEGAANIGNLAQQSAQQAGNYGNLSSQAGSQIFQTAMDPQQQLYQRTAQRLTDQVNAGQALRGLGNSPEGAAEYNQAMANFNIDWQNQQLQRQLSGLQGLNQANQVGIQGQNAYAQGLNTALNANSAVGRDLTGAAQLASQIPQNYLEQAQLPFQAQLTAAQYPFQAINQATGAYTNVNQAPLSTIGNQALSYLYNGAGAQNAGFNAQLAANQQQFGQNSSVMSSLLGLGNSASGLSGLGGLGQNVLGALSGSNMGIWGAGNYSGLAAGGLGATATEGAIDSGILGGLGTAADTGGILDTIGSVGGDLLGIGSIFGL